MVLDKISIINYKNIRQASLDFSNKINCFIGDNGEGKTNLLDAVYYLSFCRSSSTHIDSQLITHNEQLMVLEGVYHDEQGEENIISCGIKPGQKKHFRRNKKEYKRLSTHIGLIPLIMVSPSDSSLIDTGSEDRRKFMDIVISQLDRSYMDCLSRYSKALQQRNALLKMEEEPDAMLLDLWEQEMAQSGEQVYERRNRFIKEFVPVFQKLHDMICGGKEKVELNYVSHCQRGPLLEVIQRDRFKDRAVGYSLHGIHRDDLEMSVGGYPLKREGSQGQNKTFVMAMKLAQFEFLRRTESHTLPILLLDDIFDKLDAGRVERIVSLVAGSDFGQIFISDTNRGHLDKILAACDYDYKMFNVKGGEIVCSGSSQNQ